MLATVEEANGKWCPMTRIAHLASESIGDGVYVGNRAYEPVDGDGGFPLAQCLGDRCMAWCWVAGLKKGYCGLAGQ